MQPDLFTVEYRDGTMLDDTGDGGFTVWLSRADAQDAAESHDVEKLEDLQIVRYVREA